MLDKDRGRIYIFLLLLPSTYPHTQTHTHIYIYIVFIHSVVVQCIDLGIIDVQWEMDLLSPSLCGVHLIRCNPKHFCLLYHRPTIIKSTTELWKLVMKLYYSSPIITPPPSLTCIPLSSGMRVNTNHPFEFLNSYYLW